MCSPQRNDNNLLSMIITIAYKRIIQVYGFFYIKGESDLRRSRLKIHVYNWLVILTNYLLQHSKRTLFPGKYLNIFGARNEAFLATGYPCFHGFSQAFRFQP